MKHNGKELVKTTTAACPILARDSKGFGNYTQTNAVMEIPPRKQADGIYVGKSQSFTKPPLENTARTILTDSSNGTAILIIDECTDMQKATRCEVVGMLDNNGYEKMHDMSRRVYSVEGAAPALHTCSGGNLEPKIFEQNSTPRIAAMRGRNPENPADRTKGSHTEQRLEIGGEIANTLTTVQKDNLVVEPCEQYIGCAVHPLSKKLEFDGYNDGPCPTLLATDYKCPKTVAFSVPPEDNNEDTTEPIIYDGFNQRIRAEKGTTGSITRNVGADLKRNGQGVIEPITQIDMDSDSLCVDNVNLRVRKLTERECFRLMGVKGEDFNACAQHQSKSSLYHLAGDSIVSTCLMAIMGVMLGIDYVQKIKEIVSELRDK